MDFTLLRPSVRPSVHHSGMQPASQLGVMSTLLNLTDATIPLGAVYTFSLQLLEFGKFLPV